MIYKQYFPTRWPILEFRLSIWKLTVATAIMRESLESLSYEYLILLVAWNGKEIHRFRLYDTERRAVNRLEGIYSEPQPIALKRLKEIKKIVNEEIKKLTKNK